MIVPLGAKAGDFVGWTPCADHVAPASCGTLIVPERHDATRSRLIALPVVRWRATNVVYEEPIFWMAGGPGRSNLRVLPPDSMRARHDVVLVGYRGVDGSTRRACPEARVSMTGIGANLLGRETRSGIARSMQTCAFRLPGDTVDAAAYTIDAVVADLESARVALAYPRVSIHNAPSGAPLAQAYSQRHPERVYRAALTDGITRGHVVPAGNGQRAFGRPSGELILPAVVSLTTAGNIVRPPVRHPARADVPW